MTKKAMVFRRKDKLFLHADSRTVIGAWISTPPFLSVDVNDTNTTKGRAMREALDGSTGDVPHPTDFDALLQPVYELAGVKSWASFVKGVSCCRLSEEGAVVHVTPWVENAGGLVPEEQLAIQLDDPTDEEIAGAVEKALNSVTN